MSEKVARYDKLFGDVKYTVSTSIANVEEEMLRSSKEMQWRLIDCENLLKSRVNETFVKEYANGQYYQLVDKVRLCLFRIA